MRLCRGLEEPHRPEQSIAVIRETRQGTNFTDCPYTALLYGTARLAYEARGSR